MTGLTYLATVDYRDTPQEFIKSGKIIDKAFPFSGFSMNGRDQMVRVFEVVVSDASVREIMAIAHRKGARGADALELCAFCVKHPDVLRGVKELVGLGSSRPCYMTECHEKYPVVFAEGETMYAGMETTDESDKLGEGLAYLLVYE